MKIWIYTLTLLIAACQPSRDPELLSTEGNYGTISDSIVEEKIKQAETEDSAAVVRLPEPVKEEIREIKKEQIARSIFLSYQCCAKEGSAHSCCCDSVLYKFKTLINDNEQKLVGEIYSTDVIFNECMKIKEFRDEIEGLEEE